MPQEGGSMSAKGASTPTRRKGSERVKAWVYSVLNPLMEALRAESLSLSKKNITWRYSTGEMEFIVPTRDLIQPTARPNYDDLLRGEAAIKPQMEDRDGKVERLRGAASECWKQLTEYSGLQYLVEKQLKQWREEGNPYPGGAIPEDEFWLLIAEHIINNAAELPFYYTNRPFWSRFGQSLLASRVGQPFSRLEESIRDLKKSDETLIKVLDLSRSKLCDQYDIPAAPV
jgi:hypothetical protein